MDITVSANAKINLYLDITGLREDKYHNIETVMHTVDLRDSVTVSLDDSGRIRLTCDKPYIPTDEKNIAHKAAALFLSEAGKKKVSASRSKKEFPSAAGSAAQARTARPSYRRLTTFWGSRFRRMSFWRFPRSSERTYRSALKRARLFAPASAMR